MRPRIFWIRKNAGKHAPGVFVRGAFWLFPCSSAFFRVPKIRCHTYGIPSSDPAAGCRNTHLEGARPECRYVVGRQNITMQSAGTRGKRIACHNCEHYLSTWDARFPFGCRAYGFKSRRSPSLQVTEASGLECLLYTARKRPSDDDALR